MVRSFLALVLVVLCFSQFGLASSQAIVVPGRTDVQRQQLCDTYKTNTIAWNKKQGGPFAIQKADSNTYTFLPKSGCIGISNPLSVAVECSTAPKRWSWITVAGLRALATQVGNTNLCISPAFRFGVVPCNYLLYSASTDVTSIVKPAHCPCGQDFIPGTTQGACNDIDECQEDNGCPVNSFCTNVVGDYKCTCEAGYLHPASGGAQVPKFGTCEESVSFQPHSIAPFSFMMDISRVGTNKNVMLSLYQVAEGAADLLVPVQQHAKIDATFTSFSDLQTFTFDGLNPGSRYKLTLTYNDDSLEKTSDFVITKCFCSILDGDDQTTDDTGRPDNAIVRQQEGFVMFTFLDNSRCEDAYSFSRVDPNASSFEPAVFTPDYYYFSAQECAREPYSPGFQAADDLRFSRLTVGKTYNYQIRASARQPWRSSSYTTVSHTVQWQASIDGQVTLKPEAGGIPVEEVTVDYRLEDLTGEPLTICSFPTDDGWCSTKTSPSGKFRIDISLVDDSLNNEDDFPVRLRFGKQTGDIIHRFLCDEGTRDCTGADLSAGGTIQDDSPAKGPPLGDLTAPGFMDGLIAAGDNMTLVIQQMESVANDSWVFDFGGALRRRQYKRSATPYNSTVLYVRHLEFNAPVHVIDDTTVSFQGRVSVNGTYLPFDNDLGCAIPSAEVCLIDHSTRNKLQVQEPVCVTTNGTGHYSLPAVIGTTVSPQVNYHDHEFRAVNPENEILISQGIRIDAKGAYEGFDLVDVTTTSLAIEVAGGFCNHKLGTSDVRLTIQGCLWEGIVLNQDRYRQEHNVIAQFVEVRVEDVRGPDGDSRGPIVRKLSLSQDTSIDLRDVEEEDEFGSESLPEGVGDRTDENPLTAIDDEGAIAGALKEEEEKEKERTDLKTVRFQYDGQDHLRTVFGDRTESEGCGSNAASESVDSYSFHVIRMLSLFELKIFAWQDYGYADIPLCTKYEPNTTIVIQNEVGISDSPGDRKWIEKIEVKPELNALAKRIRECNPSCEVVLEMDENGSNAQASKLLVSGQPNPFNDNTKSLFATLAKSGVRHMADVVVTGDFELTGGFTVAIPSHKPILVLRDPPGGGSYSFYENMITTARVQMKHYETYVGFDSALSADFGAGVEIEGCAGFGVLACIEMTDIESKGKIDVDGGANFVVQLVDGTDSASFTTTWSYRTSTDEWVAGANSDVFLVPNLNAKFKQVDEVRFVGSESSSTCAEVERKLKFALDSPENKPAIGFLSRFDVESVEIPELTRLKAAAVKNVTELGCPDSVEAIDESTPKGCEESIVNRDVFVGALEDWRSFLERHDNITKLAKNGGLDSAKPGEWFDRNKHESADPSKLPGEHYSSLIPKKLAEQAEQVRFLAGDSDASPTGAEELEHINLIKFDGGGAEVRFELKKEFIHEHTSKIGNPQDNMKQHFAAGGGTSIDIESPVVVDIGFQAKFQQELDRVHEETDENNDETVIGFVLNDPDSGDVFDVEVFLDPDYGTFVFNTVGGRSKCPVEYGTVPREQPHVEFSPVSTTLALPDDPIVFEVRLTNQGISPAAFQLFTEHRANSGVLGHLANGDTLTVPQQYDKIDAGETISTFVSVYRGPATYDHPGFKLLFRSACENVRNIGDGNLVALGNNVATASTILYNVFDASFPEGQKERMRFAEPCPAIQWEGDLADDESFRINLVDTKTPNSFTITVHNPLAPGKSFARMANETSGRFLEAGVWFRQVGTTKWYRAFSEQNKPIDFAKLYEDEYGWVDAKWFVGGLPDGSYEIEARTLCKPSSEMPVDFQFSKTQRIAGTIDRQRPDLFGAPSPRVGNLFYPGQFFEFYFTEALHCSQPFVFGVKVAVQHSSSSQDEEIIDDELIRVLCEDKSIRVAFHSRLINYVDLLSTNITVTLTGVEDRNGNPIDPMYPATTSVQFASLEDIFHEIVGLQIVFPSQALDQDKVKKEIADTTGLPSEQIQIRSMVSTQSNTTSVWVLLDPPAESQGQVGGPLRAICGVLGLQCGSSISRDSIPDNAVTPLAAYYRLKEANESYVSLSEPVLQSPFWGRSEVDGGIEVSEAQDSDGRRLEARPLNSDLESNPLNLLVQEIHALREESHIAAQTATLFLGVPLLLLSVGLSGYVFVLSQKVKSLDISSGYSRV